MNDNKRLKLLTGAAQLRTMCQQTLYQNLLGEADFYHHDRDLKYANKKVETVDVPCVYQMKLENK